MAARNRGPSGDERLRRLQSVTDAALGHLSVDELLSELLLRIRDALDADTCAILLLDEDRQELVARAAKGIEEEVERGVRIPVGKGFAGRVAAERRPVVLDDVDHADVLNPILHEKGIKSLVGAPLLARQRVLGVVHVGTLAPRRFEPEDVELLEFVAERVALGLDRALVHEELLRLDAIKSELLSTAAHELRTPATVIYGVAETLAGRGDELDPQDVRGLVDAFYDASVRLAQLTEDLLDFSRLEGGASAVSFAPVRLRKTIEEVTSGLTSEPIHEIEVEVPEELVLLSDRSALERIMGNLLKNALVHGAPPVSVRLAIDDGTARISVADRGPGIPEAFLGRLYDPFARASDAEGKPGVGLGLSIAQAYARRLGGELVYEQARPKGAIFTVVLPVPATRPPASPAEA